MAADAGRIPREEKKTLERILQKQQCGRRAAGGRASEDYSSAHINAAADFHLRC